MKTIYSKDLNLLNVFDEDVVAHGVLLDIGSHAVGIYHIVVVVARGQCEACCKHGHDGQQSEKCLFLRVTNCMVVNYFGISPTLLPAVDLVLEVLEDLLALGIETLAGLIVAKEEFVEGGSHDILLLEFIAEGDEVERLTILVGGEKAESSHLLDGADTLRGTRCWRFLHDLRAHYLVASQGARRYKILGSLLCHCCDGQLSFLYCHSCMFLYSSHRALPYSISAQ